MSIIKNINTVLSAVNTKSRINNLLVKKTPENINYDTFTELLNNPKAIEYFRRVSHSMLAVLTASTDDIMKAKKLTSNCIGFVRGDSYNKNHIIYYISPLNASKSGDKRGYGRTVQLYNSLEFFNDYPRRGTSIFLSNKPVTAYFFGYPSYMFPENFSILGRVVDDFNSEKISLDHIKSIFSLLVTYLKYYINFFEPDLNLDRYDRLDMKNSLTDIIDLVEILRKIRNNYNGNFIKDINKEVNEELKVTDNLRKFTISTILEFLSNDSDIYSELTQWANLQLAEDFSLIKPESVEDYINVFNTNDIEYEYWTSNACLSIEFRLFNYILSDKTLKNKIIDILK